MNPKAFDKNAGFSLIEVLVALVILLVGLLGLAGLQVRAQQAEMESYQRAQALVLLQDMVDRINANRKVASCYAITTDTANGLPSLGTGYSGAPACAAGTAQQNATAVADLTAWSNALKGAAETAGGGNIGAMIGARGCVSYDNTAAVYTVSVAWQGLSATAAPSGLTCGKGQYGDESRRRAVSATVRIATLSP
jgi:type IV pilus assembly protein PilV